MPQLAPPHTTDDAIVGSSRTTGGWAVETPYAQKKPLSFDNETNPTLTTTAVTVGACGYTVRDYAANA